MLIHLCIKSLFCVSTNLYWTELESVSLNPITQNHEQKQNVKKINITVTYYVITYSFWFKHWFISCHLYGEQSSSRKDRMAKKISYQKNLMLFWIVWPFGFIYLLCILLPIIDNWKKYPTTCLPKAVVPFLNLCSLYRHLQTRNKTTVCMVCSFLVPLYAPQIPTEHEQ